MSAARSWRLDRSTPGSRATETADRLRHGGGAYLRLRHDGMPSFHEGLHVPPAAGGAALGLGHSCFRYVTPANSGGHDAHASAQGVFTGGERG